MIDAHQHFWDPSRASYGWMSPEVAPIARRFGPTDIEPLLREFEVAGTILVEARPTLAETYELLDIAESSRFVVGVVGWIDLTDPHVADVVTQLRSHPAGHRLVGFRHHLADESDPRWLERDDVRRGLGAVEQAGLAFDLLLSPSVTASAVRVARGVPGLRFVLDHIGNPMLDPPDLEGWTATIRAFAKLDNVTCKFSGMVTRVAAADHPRSVLAPFAAVLLDTFGPRRLMFGSDWPVCLLAAPYAAVVDLARELTSNLSATEASAVFEETARGTYGLPDTIGRHLP